MLRYFLTILFLLLQTKAQATAHYALQMENNTAQQHITGLKISLMRH